MSTFTSTFTASNGAQSKTLAHTFTVYATSPITLSATFPTDLHVGDTGSFVVTATEADGATGSLTITADTLPDGMTLGSTTDNGDGTFSATVSYDLTTEQDVTASFSATGGSVAATALTHEFNVQAAVSSGPTLVRVVPNAPVDTTGSGGIDLDVGAVQAGDQIVVTVGVNGAIDVVVTITDSQTSTFDTQIVQDAANNLTNFATRTTIAADAADYSVHVAPNKNARMAATVYLLRSKTLTPGTVYRTEASAIGGAFTAGPYSTAKPAFLAMVATVNQGSTQTFTLNTPTTYTTDAVLYNRLLAHWLTTAAVTNDTQNMTATATNPYTAVMIVPYTWS